MCEVRIGRISRWNGDIRECRGEPPLGGSICKYVIQKFVEEIVTSLLVYWEGKGWVIFRAGVIETGYVVCKVIRIGSNGGWADAGRSIGRGRVRLHVSGCLADGLLYDLCGCWRDTAVIDDIFNVDAFLSTSRHDFLLDRFPDESQLR